MLQQSLDMHPDIICRHELFATDRTPVGQLEILDNFFNKNGFRVEVNKHKTAVKAIGFKVKIMQVADQDAFARFVFDNNIKIIYMPRLDPVRHALSRYVGDRFQELTGSRELHDINKRITPIHVDMSVYNHNLIYKLNAEKELGQFMMLTLSSSITVLKVPFEKFIVEIRRHLVRVESWLGIPAVPHAIPDLVKVVPHDLRTAVKNYDEFVKFLSSTDFSKVFKKYIS